PKGQRRLISSDALSTDGGTWQPGTVTEPPFSQLPAGKEADASTMTPDGIIGVAGDTSEGPGQGLLRPRGVAVDGQGNVYVGDRGHHRIVVYSPEGQIIYTWGNAPRNECQLIRRGEFSDITDLTVSDDGSIYVLDGASHLLQVFDHE